MAVQRGGALLMLLQSLGALTAAAPLLQAPKDLRPVTHASPVSQAADYVNTCPAVATQGNFNLTEWIRASWYIQQQQVTGYQSPEDLFCVLATYELEGREVPGFDGTVISVYNYQNRGAVNGPGECGLGL